MSISDKLQILLITYNRKNHLQKTFDQIFAEDSPIKNMEITVLDNASTDGTSELIQEYSKKFPNIVHIKHKRNIGGNANIARAFELGASSGKEYVWVLCDDDKYDFSNWSEVEENINNKVDAICVADYVFPSNEKNNVAYQLFQLTFVPAGIYKTENITDDVLTNMYDSIYTMFQQSVISMNIVNNNGNIQVLSKPVVFNGIHFDDRVENLSLTRGYNEKFIPERRKHTNWILGYSNVLTLLKNNNLKTECIEVAILYKDIYSSWENFYNSVAHDFLNKNNFNYFYEIFRRLTPERQKDLKTNYSSSINEVLSLISFEFDFVYCLRCYFFKFISSIFSIKNQGKHKVITFLGLKLKLPRKKYKKII